MVDKHVRLCLFEMLCSSIISFECAVACYICIWFSATVNKKWYDPKWKEVICPFRKYSRSWVNGTHPRFLMTFRQGLKNFHLQKNVLQYCIKIKKNHMAKIVHLFLEGKAIVCSIVPRHDVYRGDVLIGISRRGIPFCRFTKLVSN